MKVISGVILLLLLLGGGEAGVGDMSKCPAQRLDVCEPVLLSNTFAACETQSGQPLPSGRKGVEPSKAPLGHFMLKMMRWLSAKDSWSDSHLKDDSFDRDAIKHDLKSAKSIGYSPLGAVAILLGIVLILFLLVFLFPVLWCRCTRAAWFPKAAERPRTKRTVVIVCFAVLLVLACLFYYGAMWYSFWASDDFKATSCTVAGYTHQTFYQDVSQDGNSRFKGLNSLINDAEVSKERLDVFGGEQGLSTITGADFVSRALVSAFAPLLWTSQMLNEQEFKGWPGVAESGTEADTFRLNLVSVAHPKWSHQPVSDSDPDQFTIKWVETYGPLLSELQKSKALQDSPFASGQTAGDALNKATSQFSDFDGDLTTWQDQLLNRYNEAIDYIKDADPHKKGPKAARLAVIIISAITFLGVIAGIVIFTHYIRTEQHLNPLKRPGHKMTYFAGFMSFGYIFWAIILFVLGGILMCAAYFPSDGCHIVGQKIVEEGDWERYNATFSVNDNVRTACLMPDADGDLLSKKVSSTSMHDMSNFTIAGLDSLSVKTPDPNTTKLEQFVNDADWASMTFIFGDIEDNHLLGPGVPKDAQLKAAVPDSQGVTCDKSATKTAQAVCKAGGMAAINAAPAGTASKDTNIVGMDQVAEVIIKKFLTGMTDAPTKLCYKEPCESGVPLVDNSTVPNRSGMEWSESTASLYKSPDEHLEAASQFVINKSTPPDTDTIADWFESLRHVVRLNMLNGNFLRSGQAALPESTTWTTFVDAISPKAPVSFPKGFSDPCPIETACPIFYSLKSRTDLSQGFQLVDYDTWKKNVKDDTIAAIQHLSTTEDILNFVKKQSTSQTSVESVRARYDTFSSDYDCRVMRSTAQKIRTRLCENLFADLAAVSIFWFLLALCHIFAFVMAFMYWLARKRDGETAKEEDETETPAPPPVKPEKYSKGDFLQAAEHGDYPVMKECAEIYKPNTVVDPDYQNSPLHLAAYYGHVECVKELLARGWSPNELNFHHYTPTTACVTNHNLPFETKSVIVTDLVNAGGNLDIFDHYGNTSLMIATRANERQLVELLLQLGANPDVEDDYHVDSLQLAQSFGHSELYGLLTEASPRRSGLSPR